MTVESVLRAHAPVAPPQLRTRVLALEPRRAPSRRLVLVLAVALGIAIAAAVVHALVSSSPKQQTAIRHLAPKVFAQGPAASGGGGGAVRGAVPSIGAIDRLQRTEATLDVRVKDVASATTRATQIATSLGGYAQSVRYRTLRDGAGLSYIELRVPASARGGARSRKPRRRSATLVWPQNLSVTGSDEHDLQRRVGSRSRSCAGAIDGAD